MGDTTIRRAVPADKGVWLEMRMGLWPGGGEDAHIQEIDKRLLEPERYPSWIAQGEKGPCGFIEASLNETVPGCMASPVGLIAGWFVAIGYQGRGIGGKLIQAAEKWALERGALEMGSVTDTCPIRRAAHRRLGYKEIFTEGAAWYFIKELTPAEPVFGGPEQGITYQTRRGAYAVIEDDGGRVAVMRVPKGLFLPGGGMEGLEDYRSCLVREIREEMGRSMELVPGGFIGRAVYYGDSQRIEKPLHIIACFYRAQITGKMGAGSDADHELVWLNPEKAAGELYLPHQRWAVVKACGHKGV